ncbi:quinol monooxygenase YgiN [Leifsonia sp. EB41]|jgi:quinol monooxygenase YgiN|uniref:putative quinol monooxygenase n=1 Tax=Leifsonia sp. EB41 TaxID=3156260 RepID=UPI003515483C
MDDEFIPPSDFVAETLAHPNLTVDPQDPNPRPMIAILDAVPGRHDDLRAAVIELARKVRLEPGCVEFTAYEARDIPGRFYLYEIYENARAFADHLGTEHVHTFIASIPTLSTGGPGNLIQLDPVMP